MANIARCQRVDLGSNPGTCIYFNMTWATLLLYLWGDIVLESRSRFLMPVWLSGDSATFVKWNTTPGVRVPPLAPFLVNHRHVKSEQIVCKTIVLGAVPRPVFSKVVKAKVC